MNTYHLYHRYPGGTIEYLGPCQWGSLEELLEYSQRADREPETEQLMGWKHNTVVWYGDMGIGSIGTITMLTGEDDLCVFINWSDPTAGVVFRYGWSDEQNTPFQTADFDICDPDAVVRRVDAYASEMAG